MSSRIRTRRPTFGMTAEAAAVEAARRLCSNCKNGYLGEDGVLCRPLNEVIWDEKAAAADCELFDQRREGNTR